MGRKKQQICDKTPRYMAHLDKILDKLPPVVPCIVIEKDITNLWRSHKKRNMSMEDFCQQFEQYNRGLGKAVERHGNRIHRVKYEVLCNDLYNTLSEIFMFTEMEFKEEYAHKRSSEIRQYYHENYTRGTPLPEKEALQLQQVKMKFTNL